MLRSVAIVIMGLMAVPAMAGPAWLCLCEGAPEVRQPCCCDHDEPAGPAVSDDCCCEVRQGTPEAPQSTANLERASTWQSPDVVGDTAVPPQQLHASAAPRPVERATGPPLALQHLRTIKLRP